MAFARKPTRNPIKDTRPVKGRIDLNKQLRAASDNETKLQRQRSDTSRAKAPIDASVDRKSPWYLEAADFPRTGGRAAQLRFCLRAAVLAPSSHNSQPWKFRIDGSTVELWADRSRALPVVDPHDRELTISCGAALYNFRLALSRFMLSEQTTLCPDPVRHDLFAVVRTDQAERACTPEQGWMFKAIMRRRTTRQAFEPDRMPSKEAIASWQRLASTEGATLTVLATSRERMLLAKLVAEADQVQFGNSAFRRELALWMHHNRSHSHDGVPGYAMGMKELSSLMAPLVVRTFDVGRATGARDEELVMHSPVLAVLSSRTDDETGWLQAGQALSAVLLRAAADDITSSYLNQPIEVAELRPRLAKLAGDPGYPQLVLRMGYAEPPPHTPRRTVDEVLMHDPITSAIKGKKLRR